MKHPTPKGIGRLACLAADLRRYPPGLIPSPHPGRPRAQAAALQTFPDGYIFHGTMTHIAKQIGNAVPFRLAETIGKSILELGRSHL